MDLICDERPSDSPFVEIIWHSQSGHADSFISMAEPHYGIVVTKYRGKTTLTIRGPETHATPAYGPEEAEFFGIVFKAGVFMPDFPAQTVMDRQDLNLPESTHRSFWLKGAAWQFPDYENADTFVDRLICEGLLVYDPIVGEVLKSHAVEMSLRTVQRRFLQATGLTQSTMYQINRARYATRLLKEGTSILDTVQAAGYFDQPHLTRSLKHFVGLTPAQIIDKDRSTKLSFLYKTVPFGEVIMPQPKDEGESIHRSQVPEPG